jgi:hypothetical protein
LPNVLSGFTNVYSFSIWAKIDNTNNFSFFSSTTSTAQSTYNNLIRFNLHQNGSYYFNFGDIYGARLTGTSPSAWTDGNWHNFVFVSTPTQKLAYVDGSLFDSASSTKAVSGLSNVILGHYGTNYADGSIDQVRIYSSALTSSQVTELYEEKPCADTSNFKTVLYEGNDPNNNTVAQLINNVGFRPDLVWIKNRDTTNNHVLMDSVRGDNLILHSNTTDVEASAFGGTLAIEETGFTTGKGDETNKGLAGYNDFVAWCWKGGGDAVSNTDGSITSQVSANTDAGFSIVKYTGNNLQPQTVGHGLNNAPEVILLKGLDANFNWHVYHASVMTGGDSKYLRLNTSDSMLTDGGSDVWTSGFSSTTFGIGRANTASGEDFIAYCWHSVAGYSKIGTYTGNSSTKLVYTDSNDDGTGTGGFQPSFVMIRSTSASRNWTIFDNKRFGTHGYNDKYLRANTSGAEVDSSDNDILEFTSTGFTLRATDLNVNGSSETYIYMAFK